MIYTPQFAREQMVRQQVRCWEVIEPRVLQALAVLPREDFVPDAFRGVAYADAEIPLPHGQRMMTPSVEGRLLQALELTPLDQVLEIGTGSGFLTACLARLGAHVTSIEIHQDLVAAARAKLAQLGLENCELQAADAFAYKPPTRFDVIAVTGSIPSYAGQFDAWLKPGGRLFLIEGQGEMMEALVFRRIDDKMLREALFETYIPPLFNAPVPQRFAF